MGALECRAEESGLFYSCIEQLDQRRALGSRRWQGMEVGGRKPMEKIVPKLGLDIQKDKEKRKSTLPHKHTHRRTHAHPPHTV